MVAEGTGLVAEGSLAALGGAAAPLHSHGAAALRRKSGSFHRLFSKQKLHSKVSASRSLLS